MNPNIKGNWNPMADDYYDTILYSISNSMDVNTIATFIINGLAEVSQTDNKATFIGFGHGLSILNVYSIAAIDIPNGVDIVHLNRNSLIQRHSNSLVSTARDHNICSYI